MQAMLAVLRAATALTGETTTGHGASASTGDSGRGPQRTGAADALTTTWGTLCSRRIETLRRILDQGHEGLVSECRSGGLVHLRIGSRLLFLITSLLATTVHCQRKESD